MSPSAPSLPPIPAGVFRARRERALERMEEGVLLLPAAPVRHRSRDVEVRYRPDSELYYLTGWTEPGALAVLRAFAEEDRFVLFVPSRDPGAEVWSGPRMGPAEAGERTGADAVYPAGEVEERLPGLLRGSSRVFVRLGEDPRLDRLVLDSLRTSRIRGARRGEGPRGIVDPGEVLDELRLRKGPEEIARIREAARITVEAFREVLAGVRPGVGEWEVEALLESGFRRRGAAGAAFPTIAASGPNGCYLHYAENGRVLEEGDLLLLDGGAEVELYAADVTRTVSVGGEFGGAGGSVHEVVRHAHAAGVAAVRPGATVAEVHRAVVDVLTEGLVELGVLEGEVEELVAGEAFKPFYPHQTSHWLGLDVHDVGDYARRGEPRVLEPGMVLTVEPGLYFAPRPDGEPTPFDGIGVRLEDDLLVTPEGVENLTGALPLAGP